MSDPSLNPLLPIHQQAEAEFQPYADVQIVSTFGEPQAEYAAIRKGAALLDQPQRGFLEFTGKDRLSFLNNLLTNQTWDKETKSAMKAGEGVYAFFLNKQGRLTTDVNVIERGDRTILEMDARLVEPLRTAFDKYLFTEQVKMTNRSGALHALALHGPGGHAILNDAAAAAGAPLAELGPMQSTEVTLLDTPAIVWRDDETATPGYHLIVTTEQTRPLWLSLLDRFGEAREPGKRRLRPAGWAAFNATRIEAGRPIFGIDFDDTVLPAETGQMARAVSLTKGCYLGQEIVARMHARQQVARQLVGIKMDDDALPIAGSPVFDEQSNQVGAITSSTISPVLSNAAICLAFVKRAFIPPGSVVQVPAEGSIRRATVVELPFFK